MSFRQLVVCVDRSFSMADFGKLRTAKKLLKGIAKAFDCSNGTHYYAFDETCYELTASEFDELEPVGGTKIEKTLKDLFSNKLPMHSRRGKTKFIFVTDAEDTIKNSFECLDLKTRCERSSFSGNLDCECVLIGKGGECVDELRRIFGGQFKHCSDSNHNKVLNAMVSGIAVVNNITEQAEQIDKKLEVIKEVISDEDMKECIEESQRINQVVMKNHAKISGIDEQVQAVNQELKDLKKKKEKVASEVNQVKYEEEIERIQRKIDAIREELKAKNAELNDADKELNTVNRELEIESLKAKKTVVQLKQKNSVLSLKAAEIISEISKHILALNSLTAGAKDEIDRVKKDFQNKLSDLAEMVSKNTTLFNNLGESQGKIRKSVRKLKCSRANIKDVRSEILLDIRGLNALLDILEDKLDKLDELKN